MLHKEMCVMSKLRFMALWMLASMLAVVLVLVFVFPVFAATLGEEAPEAPELVAVLRLLTQGVGVGAVIAFLFEKLTWFQSTGAKAKWWIIFGLSMGLPMLAQLLLQFIPPDVWTMLEPYWRVIATGFMIWVGSQGIHMVDRYLTQARAKSSCCST